VLDVGSGSGTDALIAARLVGPSGRVIGLDLTEAMRDKLRVNAGIAKAGNLEILAGNAESIPLPDASVDVVTTNGVINLVPDKTRAIREIARVLRPGGPAPAGRYRGEVAALRGVSRESGALGRVHRRSDQRGDLPRWHA
jgi:ubiquinone/menaquinone biosynthesis C-methylase UbiE